MLKANASVSSAAAGPVVVLRQVRKGVSRFQSRSKARYPCIMPEIPMTAGSRPDSPARAARSPVQTSSRE